MSAPFGPESPVVVPVNGHRHNHLVAAEPGLDVAVVRQIRREVAERLTRANRAHEAATSTPISAEEREVLTRRLIGEALDAYATAEMQAGRPPLHPHVESRVARTVADALLGSGGLQPWLKNPQVEDIVANGCDRVFVRFHDGRIEQVDPIADSDAEMVDLIRMLAARTGNDERRWDRAAPLLNLQLADGSRLNAVLDVVRRPSLSIRRHRYMTMTLPELVELGAIDTALAELFRAAVRARLNTVVGGPTGAGKTTFLRGLASAIPAWERLVTIEDTFELGFDRDEARAPERGGDAVPRRERGRRRRYRHGIAVQQRVADVAVAGVRRRGAWARGGATAQHHVAGQRRFHVDDPRLVVGRRLPQARPLRRREPGTPRPGHHQHAHR